MLYFFGQLYIPWDSFIAESKLEYENICMKQKCKIKKKENEKENIIPQVSHLRGWSKGRRKYGGLGGSAGTLWPLHLKHAYKLGQVCEP